MVIAAGIAAQAASALAQTWQGKQKPAASNGSPATDFQNLTADIDALLPGGATPGSAGPGSGTGSITGDLAALGNDLLGNLGLAAPSVTAPASAAQAYAATGALGGA